MDFCHLHPLHIELAWAAGFFDGEGSVFFTTNRNSPVLAINVKQVETTTLLRFQNAVGGVALLTGPHGPYSNKTHKPAYQISNGQFEHVQAIIAMLWPYLSRPKKDQYKKALILYKNFMCKRGHKFFDEIYTDSLGRRYCGKCKNKR